MGSPTIFAGKYTKLLTQKGLMQKGGAVNQFDGVRNYIVNSTFESNTDDGWNRVKTTITSNLPTGTPTIGKLLAVAPSISSFGPYSGSAPFDTYSLFFGNVISTVVAGEGIISDAFTVEPGDLGKVLTFKLYYKSDYGASTDNWSGILGSQTWAVYIYDQTAGAWLQPAGFLGMNQNSGVGIVSGTFQSSVVSGQQYRIAVIALKNTTSTSALQIDNIYVGSQTAPIGPVVTDWVSYTPTITGFGTVAFQSFRSRRVGDTLEIEGYFQAGTVSAATASFTIGYNGGNGNVSIDNPGKIVTNAVVGRVGYNQSSSTFFGAYVLCTSSGSTLNFSAQTSTVNNLATSVSGNFFVSGSVLQLNASVPISGWSSNVQLSNDTDTRVVAFRATRTSSQSFPNVPALPGTVVQFDSIKNDTHGAWDSVNYRYIIPVSGYYDISARFLLQFGTNTAEIVAYLVVDGTVVALQQDFKAATASGNQGIFARFLWNLNAGQAVQVRMYQANSGGGAINGVFELGGIEHGAMYVNRLSGPSVVAASETVAASAINTSAQSILNTTLTNVTGWTVQQNTHGSLATDGQFTAPVSGFYVATLQLGYAANVNGFRAARILLDGVAVSYAEAPGSNFIIPPITHWAGRLNAGQILRPNTYQTSGSPLSINSDGNYNKWIIVRVGN